MPMNTQLSCRLLTISFTLLASGCIQVPDELGFLPTGTPFTIRGTAAIIDNGGPCPVWIGENGITYHLFQDPLLDNAVYDIVTTPGTTSRLVVATRSDLVVTCQVGTIIQVQDVLEIVE